MNLAIFTPLFRTFCNLRKRKYGTTGQECGRFQATSLLTKVLNFDVFSCLDSFFNFRLNNQRVQKLTRLDCPTRGSIRGFRVRGILGKNLTKYRVFLGKI